MSNTTNTMPELDNDIRVGRPTFNLTTLDTDVTPDEVTDAWGQWVADHYGDTLTLGHVTAILRNGTAFALWRDTTDEGREAMRARHERLDAERAAREAAEARKAAERAARQVDKVVAARKSAERALRSLAKLGVLTGEELAAKLAAL